jgi:hypothetical protein
MGAKRAYRRYSGKAKVGARRVVASRSKVKRVERAIEEEAIRLERKVVRGAKRIEKAAVKDIKKAEKLTAKELKHLSKDLTLFCDNCGKAMRPGGHVSRMFGGKELRFCSALCSARFRPDTYA